MAEIIYKGILSFINHDKGYATVEYDNNGKTKTANFKLNGIASKAHNFRTGDHVSFNMTPGAGGSRLVASGVKFLYNHELEKLINQAKIENIFKGFLKMADGKLFVKELNSYLFFPLILSKWEKSPGDKMFNEAFDFVLQHTDKPDKMSAVLFKNDFIPEYKTAMRHWKNNTVLEAAVYKVSPYAMYLDVMSSHIQAKIPITPTTKTVQPGEKLNVRITYLSPSKIVVEQV